MKYGDVVVLVQKSSDGKSITRTNAIVLSSFLQPDGADKFDARKVDDLKLLKDHTGKAFPGGEYLDLAVPNDFSDSVVPKVRDMDAFFKPWHTVAPWNAKAFLGWQPGSATAVAPMPAPKQPEADEEDELQPEESSMKAQAGKAKK